MTSTLFIVILLALTITAAHGHESTIPVSVRSLIKGATRQSLTAPVEMQLDAAEDRLRLLLREKIAQKGRLGKVRRALQSSLVRADLRITEAKTACEIERNYNRSVTDCTKLMNTNLVVNRTMVRCDSASNNVIQGACYAENVVPFQILAEVFTFRCQEVEKLSPTIQATRDICGDLVSRLYVRRFIRDSQNPAVLEMSGLLIGLDVLYREIELLKQRIEVLRVSDPLPTMSMEIEGMMGMGIEATPTMEPESGMMGGQEAYPSMGPELGTAVELEAAVTVEPAPSGLM